MKKTRPITPVIQSADSEKANESKDKNSVDVNAPKLPPPRKVTASQRIAWNPLGIFLGASLIGYAIHELKTGSADSNTYWILLLGILIFGITSFLLVAQELDLGSRQRDADEQTSSEEDSNANRDIS